MKTANLIKEMFVDWRSKFTEWFCATRTRDENFPSYPLRVVRQFSSCPVSDNSVRYMWPSNALTDNSVSLITSSYPLFFQERTTRFRLYDRVSRLRTTRFHLYDRVSRLRTTRFHLYDRVSLLWTTRSYLCNQDSWYLTTIHNKNNRYSTSRKICARACVRASLRVLVS